MYKPDPISCPCMALYKCCIFSHYLASLLSRTHEYVLSLKRRKLPVCGQACATFVFLHACVQASSPACTEATNE